MGRGIVRLSLYHGPVRGEWSLSRPGVFIPGERTHGGWVGPRAGLQVLG